MTLVALVALSLIPGLGSKTLERLLAHFGELDAILAASESDLQAVPRIGPKLSAAICSVDLSRTRTEIAAWQATGIQILTREDNRYPVSLRALDDTPPILFQRGAPE